MVATVKQAQAIESSLLGLFDISPRILRRMQRGPRHTLKYPTRRNQAPAHRRQSLSDLEELSEESRRKALLLLL